jgi:hypothetical protein
MNATSDRRFEILNMGIPRTSPREYFSVLVKEALPLKPDVALICIFVGNDFIEISPKPVLHRSFVISASKYVIDLFRKVEANNVYGNRSQYDDDAPTFSDAYFLEIEAGRTEVYDQSNTMLSERLPRVMTWIDEIQTVCEINSIKLFVMLIPDELQLNTGLQERVIEKLGTDKDKLDFDRPNKRLREELRTRNIRYLDLLEPFRLRNRDVPYKTRDTTEYCRKQACCRPASRFPSRGRDCNASSIFHFFVLGFESTSTWHRLRLGLIGSSPASDSSLVIEIETRARLLPLS